MQLREVPDYHGIYKLVVTNRQELSGGRRKEHVRVMTTTWMIDLGDTFPQDGVTVTMSCLYVSLHEDADVAADTVQGGSCRHTVLTRLPVHHQPSHKTICCIRSVHILQGRGIAGAACVIHLPN